MNSLTYLYADTNKKRDISMMKPHIVYIIYLYLFSKLYYSLNNFFAVDCRICITNFFISFEKYYA